jgi:hypothetical protein
MKVFKPYVKDYAINLFEIAYLTEKKVKQFKFVARSRALYLK